MEAPWIQHLRDIVQKQRNSIVDGSINSDHRLMLKRRDASEVDAGPIRVKPQGSIVLFVSPFGTPPDPPEPDIYVTKDGVTWQAASSQNKFAQGEVATNKVDCGCWTGDRFMVPVYGYIETSMMYSRDGGNWNWHPDKETFSLSANGLINGMDATGDGLVVTVGKALGVDADQYLVVSRDFGETWAPLTSLDVDPAIGFEGLQVICIKNEFEWVIGDYTNTWYTFDGGGHWSQVIVPTDWAIDRTYIYGSGVRFFNDYWWFHGQGYGIDEWDTPIIKSVDLRTWAPVVTPWSGTYPPVQTYFDIEYLPGTTHDSNSGVVDVMEVDRLTNTMICSGSNQFNQSLVMMSHDGGLNWFEIGWDVDAHFVEDYGWVGIYKWSSYGLSANLEGGIAFGYGWWYIANRTTPGDIYPSMFRISPSGEITEYIYPPQHKDMLSVLLLAGGDVTPA